MRNRVSEIVDREDGFVASVGFLVRFLFIQSHKKQYINAGTTLNHDNVTSILLDMIIRWYCSEDERMLSEDEGAHRNNISACGKAGVFGPTSLTKALSGNTIRTESRSVNARGSCNSCGLHIHASSGKGAHKFKVKRFFGIITYLEKKNHRQAMTRCIASIPKVMEIITDIQREYVQTISCRSYGERMSLH